MSKGRPGTHRAGATDVWRRRSAVSQRTPKGQQPRAPKSAAKQGGSGGRQSVQTPAAPARSAGPTSSGRQSVASTREMSREANRTQMIIGGIAIAVIIVIVVVGLVINRQQNASPVTDHPVSTNSTASVDNGVVTVTGGNPAITIDMYEDGICPACREFEGQYGQQMMKAVDEGKLAIRFHFLDFLNPRSASKTYSSRVAAALVCVGAVPPGQAPKGLFLNFHTTMFSAGVQPAESTGADLSNAQIAAIAGKAGAPASATSCISGGTGLAAAQATAKAGEAELNQAIGAGWTTPTVLRDGKPVGINSNDWLTDMLA